MSFDVNPSEWRPQASTNKAQALDNNGRGSSAGGGFAGSAFGKKEIQPNEDEIELSSSHKKDIDEQMQEDFSTMFSVVINFLKNLIKKLFNF